MPPLAVVLLLVTASLQAPAVPAPPPDSDAGSVPFGEVVVTARRGPPRPPPDPVAYYQRYCFDANRLTGRSATPADDPDWAPLDPRTRAQFRISDPNVPAFGLYDVPSDQKLVLKFEEFDLSGGLHENRCTLVVIGGSTHMMLRDRMSRLFHGGGTRRHVGHALGVDRVAGWGQWVWTGMPSRKSQEWRSINGGHGNPTDSWLVVTDLRYYDQNDYILGDLKTRTDASRPVSILSFAYTTRPGRPVPGR